MGFSGPLSYRSLSLTNSTWQFQRVIFIFLMSSLMALLMLWFFLRCSDFFHDFSPSCAHKTDYRQHFTLKSYLILVHFYFVLSQFHIKRTNFSLVFHIYFQFCTQIVVLFFRLFSSQLFFNIFYWSNYSSNNTSYYYFFNFLFINYCHLGS